ncbi:MAG: hypothetical protein ACTHZM_01740 [Canibacter sp.]
MQQFGRLLVCVLVLTLTGCSLGSDVDEPAPTLPQAAENYLTAVCPVNEKWDEVDLTVDALEIEQDQGESGDSETVKKALSTLAYTAEKAAQELESQPWPEAAANDIQAVADALRNDAATAHSVQKLSAEKIISYQWPDAAKTAKLTEQIRQKLQATQNCNEFIESQQAQQKESEHAD